MLIQPPFLHEYRSAVRQAPRLERVLAVGRALLALSALAAIYADPTEPSRFPALAYALLAMYAVYSLSVLLVVQFSVGATARLPPVLHGIDIVWAAAITLFSEGPVSPFFLFFVFALLAAAFRWGIRETLATALVAVLVVGLETILAEIGPWRESLAPHSALDTTHVITRISYLLLTGVLLGYLAEQDKGLRAELAASAHIVRQPRVALGFSGSVGEVARVLARTFDASGVAVVIDDRSRDRARLWSLSPGGKTDTPLVTTGQLGKARREVWLFDAPSRAWYAQGGATSEVPALTLDPATLKTRRVSMTLPDRLRRSRSFTSLAGVDLGLPGEWRGRVYLFDPSAMPHALEFLEHVAEHLTPVLSNVLLLRRLRVRAGAAERARVARELHDGAIQAFVGIEMRTEALRRTAERAAPTLVEELASIQGLLRQEVTALRELMQQLQPVDLDVSHQLPEAVTALVERFHRETGIAARFIDEMTAPPSSLRTAHEIVRIVQEALVNVRKHSQALHVVVRLTDRPGGVRLTIEDDGRGFGFDGRLTAPELAARRLGPEIIRQRVRLIGGSLVIESRPEEGSRLEIELDVS